MPRFPPGCCARAAIGHAAAPPRSVMNARRFNRSPRRRWQAAMSSLLLTPDLRLREVDAPQSLVAHFGSDEPLRLDVGVDLAPFTTAYHTRFPEYIRDRAPIPLSWSYAVVRRFHRPASAVMVAREEVFFSRAAEVAASWALNDCCWAMSASSAFC